MNRSSLVLALVLLATPVTAQVPLNPGLCLVRVAAPADVDLGSPRRMTQEVLMLPGLPQPVINPFDNSKGVWTIDAQHRMVRFPGAAAGGGEPDRFATDPRGRRIVGTGSRRASMCWSVAARNFGWSARWTVRSAGATACATASGSMPS